MSQHGQTPLHLAAENDHSDIVKLFLKHRLELATLANGEGATCINIAAARGSVTVTRELLKFNQGDVTMLDNKVSRPRVNGYFKQKTPVIPDNVKIEPHRGIL